MCSPFWSVTTMTGTSSGLPAGAEGGAKMVSVRLAATADSAPINTKPARRADRKKPREPGNARAPRD